MKKFMVLAVGAMMIVGCSGSKKTAEVEKAGMDQLFERLDTLRQKGYMFGHQDDPFYGLTWDYQTDSSDVKNTCGDWPAVMGFELGGIEMGRPEESGQRAIYPHDSGNHQAPRAWWYHHHQLASTQPADNHRRRWKRWTEIP